VSDPNNNDIHFLKVEMHMTHDSLEMPASGSVESVINALQKVIALLDRIKNAIEESSGKIPKASIQLNTVTQATEMATVEMLNVLDTIARRIEAAEESVLGLREGLNSVENRNLIESVGQSLKQVKEDALNITMALQIQDITAQKIAAANHLIESVRTELLHELNYFQSAGTDAFPAQSDAIVHKISESTPTFDKDASFHKTAQHQKNIDKVVLQWREQQTAVR
jgi:chemotaxis regulatin CheY-phosphate phosphatase CheZ